MRINIKILLVLLVGVIFQSCNTASPRKYIEVAVLNTNRITRMYQPGFFSEMRELKNQNRLTVFENGKPKNGTAVEYVRQTAITPVEEYIAKVRVLKETDDTRDLLTASLDVLQYGKGIFESDYISIAKMLDEDKSQAEVDAAIQKLFETRDPEMEEKFKRLDGLAIPYAEKHDVPLEYM
jgi:hypothetical protein